MTLFNTAKTFLYGRNLNQKMAWLWLGLIVLLAGVVRFGALETVWQQDPALVLEKDTPRYEQRALNYVEHGSMAMDPDSPFSQDLHDPPGYALFIATVYKIFGHDHHVLMQLQILVSLLSLVVLYQIALLLWKSAATALMVTSLMAVAPLQILYSHLIMAETLFIFLVLLMFLSGIKTIESERYTLLWALLFGAFIALSTFVRFVNYYLIVLVWLALISFKWLLPWGWKKVFTVALVITLPVVLAFSAWQVRNGQLTGVYKFSDAGSTTMLNWKAAGVLVHRQGVGQEEAQEVLKARLPESFDSLESRLKAQTELAKEVISSDWEAYWWLTKRSLRDLLLGVGFQTISTHYAAEKPEGGIDNVLKMGVLPGSKMRSGEGIQLWFLMLVVWSGAFLIGVYLLTVFGVGATFRIHTVNPLVHIFLLGTAAYYILISTGHLSAYHRMRLPAMPVFFLYAGMGMTVLLGRLASMRQKQADLQPADNAGSG